MAPKPPKKPKTLKLFDDFAHGEFIPSVNVNVQFCSDQGTVIGDEAGNAAIINQQQDPGLYLLTNVVNNNTDDFASKHQLTPTPKTQWKKLGKASTPLTVEFQNANDAEGKKLTNLRGIVIEKGEAKGLQVLTVQEGKGNGKGTFVVRVPKEIDVPTEAEFLFVNRSYKTKYFWPTAFTHVRANEDGALADIDITDAHQMVQGKDLKDIEPDSVVYWRTMVTLVSRPYTYPAAPFPNSPRKVKKVGEEFHEINGTGIHKTKKDQLALNLVLSAESVTIKACCFGNHATRLFDIKDGASEKEIESLIAENVLYHERVYKLKKDKGYNGEDQYKLIGIKEES